MRKLATLILAVGLGVGATDTARAGIIGKVRCKLHRVVGCLSCRSWSSHSNECSPPVIVCPPPSVVCEPCDPCRPGIGRRVAGWVKRKIHHNHCESTIVYSSSCTPCSSSMPTSNTRLTPTPAPLPTKSAAAPVYPRY